MELVLEEGKQNEEEADEGKRESRIPFLIIVIYSYVIQMKERGVFI